MSLPLATQLRPPPPPAGMVERPRLEAAVEQGCAGPVTLVCAPAGSGKTALVSATLESYAHPVAWVSLEPAQDDPGLLGEAVLAALELAGAPLPPSRAAFVPRLVGELAEPVVLVLDDVHVLRSRECLAELGSLILHAPGTLRLVLITRADPPLPLPVLRVRGRLRELRAADLAFTPEEADAVLRAHDVALPEALVGALLARTEGWAAGLRLAALGLQGHADPERFVADFAGDDGVVADYLVAEVLARQPRRRRALLLRTSLVDRICGELAEALTGEPGGADALAALARANGFVLRVDGARGWYRYHRLFGELLATRARRELAGELPELHRRAAAWYAAGGDGAEALRHAVAAADWDLALAVLADRWFELYVRGDGRAIRALAGALPAERLAADAEASAALACAALEVGDAAGAERHAAHARAAAPRLPEPRRSRCRETLALAELATAGLRGDFAGALATANGLLAESAAHPDSGAAAREAVVRRLLGAAALRAQRLSRAREELQRAVALARAAGLEFVAVAALGELALVDVLEGGPATRAGEALALAERRGWGSLPQLACAQLALGLAAFSDLRAEEAERHRELAAAAARRLRRRDVDLLVAELGGRLRAAAGAPDEGLRLVDDFAAVHRHGSAPPDETAALAALRARLLLAAGRPDDAEAALAPVRARPPAAVAEALLRLACGEPDEAARVLAAAREQPARHAGDALERVVLEAVALDAAGDRAGAGRALEAALGTAEASGQRAPFVELGRRMEELLRQRIRDGTAHRSVVGDLLDVFAGRSPAPRSVAPLLEPLSEREETLLRYLPTSLSNREIAAELFVTTNTVKTHLRNIYRKLDVAHRRDAVARARDLRLLSASRR